MSSCNWIEKGLNVLIAGPTGTGKTWLGCAFGRRACTLDHPVQFYRLNLLLDDLIQTQTDGTFRKRLAVLNRSSLLILDDLGAKSRLSPQQCEALLELVDSRTSKSTLVTSQLPLRSWYEYLSAANPTTADAILDRLFNSSVKIELAGESMRKRYARKLD